MWLFSFTAGGSVALNSRPAGMFLNMEPRKLIMLRYNLKPIVHTGLIIWD